MVQHGLSSFRPTEAILTHERKAYKREANITVLDFKTQMLSGVVVGLPVPLGYDCIL